jgi:hypothetical protein
MPARWKGHKLGWMVTVASKPQVTQLVHVDACRDNMCLMCHKKSCLHRCMYHTAAGAVQQHAATAARC